MKALITGAGGFLGSALARRLSNLGEKPRCLLRPGGNSALLEGLSVEIVRGDVVKEQPELEQAVQGCEVVFHLAGIRRAPGKEDFFQVNTQGTKAICQAMLRAAPTARLVLASSIAAMGPRDDFPNEEALLQPKDWYGQSKAAAEKVAMSYAPRLAIAIARPSRVVGPGDRENLFFFRMIQKKWKILIGWRQPLFSFIDVEDVVESLLLLAKRPEAVGESFFLTNATATLNELQNEVAQVLGIVPHQLYIPSTLFRATALICDGISGFTGHHLPVNRKMAQQLLVPGWTCSAQKAKTRLGFEPKVTLRQSIERSAQWYREKGWMGMASEF
jgi:nucleoside-diphosphate-sugar epimerase